MIQMDVSFGPMTAHGAQALATHDTVGSSSSPYGSSPASGPPTGQATASAGPLEEFGDDRQEEVIQDIMAGEDPYSDPANLPPRDEDTTAGSSSPQQGPPLLLLILLGGAAAYFGVL